MPTPDVRAFAGAALLLVLSTAASAATLTGSAILKGLPRTGFSVAVEPLDPDAKKSGLTEAGIAKVIQSRMEKARVAQAANGAGEIYARIVVLTSTSVTGEVLGYGGHVELSCREKAVLKRDKSVDFMAPVWFKGNVTVANPKTFVAQVVRVVAELTDQFLADFKRENP
jgi:hypothetical protein